MKIESSFIKTTLPDSQSAQKALLNRKGNEFFNAGNIEQARRIFLATGYSDGLNRVGDYYIEHDRITDGLHMYVQAHNTGKISCWAKQIAELLQSILYNDGEKK